VTPEKGNPAAAVAAGGAPKVVQLGGSNISGDTTSPVCMQACLESETLLASLRVLTAQFRLSANQIDGIGVALRGGLITPATAIEWLDEINVLECLPMRGIVKGAA
jgi:hypothetical protein